MTVTAAEAMTPTIGRTAKRWLFWALFALVALAIAVLSLFMTGANRPSGVPLDPEGPGPAGARAVVETLRTHGIEVDVVDTLAKADAATADGRATLLLHDRDGILDTEQLRTAGRLAERTILIDPSYAELDALAPAIAPAGIVSGRLDADCGGGDNSSGEIARAGTVSGDASGYRIVDDTDADADSSITACLGSGDDVYSHIEIDGDDTRLVIVGATGALSNGQVLADGNAAYALGLLGHHDRLVWYVPGTGDLSASDAPGIAELTPPWVTPVLVLLLLVVIAAGIWRGRRLGPLVIERLPVTVRSTETMEGRARLYQRSSARLRALDALRIGTLDRLAIAVKQPRSASVDDIVDTVAAALGRPSTPLRELLIDELPENDRDLIRMSDALLQLERELRDAIRPH
ncbi:hypothetical protein FB562_1695 [Homoserinimonas aerilata]|uniref:DUF4350 domain-containing protein n=1 Tax=Homoserinimonas aerilata TaxID=1162970 RepID=A0A542YKK2_9MICO|nr:DUF4350 domain-containing protein [Homoserinimonas aerilata]TQL48598.1 hypothetical protein FB562_1695 [Homoserinimonas aerilata]